MKILDSSGKNLAYVIKKEDINKEKNFITDNDEEFQFASFNLQKGTIINDHIHPDQKREVYKTTEVLVVIEGEMIVKIYDDSKQLIEQVTLTTGDSICLIAGGHGILTTENCKFIEVKQGPYTESIDKKLI